MSWILLGLVPLAWLVPNHYPPWSSAWSDGLALGLTFLAALCHSGPLRLPRVWAVAIFVALASVGLQWATGRILFGGDALLAIIYLVAFAVALSLGAALGSASPSMLTRRLDFAALVTVAAAIVSTGIALVQWTGALSLAIYGADVPPGGRAFGNVAQPNHLCTLLFLGLCGLALLRESGRLGALAFWTGTCFLLWGMVMTVSRTGWVQLGVTLLMTAAMGRRSSAKVGPRQLAVCGLLLAAGTLAWPALNDLLMLSGGRGAAVQIDGGPRLPMWSVLLQAIAQAPLGGYGWQQMVLAQHAMALDAPPVHYHFEHSHNIALDLLVWAGVPVGGAIIGLAGYALWRQARQTVDARGLWLLAAVAGVLLHALLEFPLEYAYFLVPTGMAVGAAYALGPWGVAVGMPARALQLVGMVGCVVAGSVALEYLDAEQSYRLLRLESARIGVLRIESVAPDLRLLTQLGAFLQVARKEASPGMTEAELERLRRTSLRFAYPPLMLRLALAQGLHSDPAGAAHTLAALCSMHSRERCDEARTAWVALQRRYPVLTAVPVP